MHDKNPLGLHKQFDDDENELFSTTTGLTFLSKVAISRGDSSSKCLYCEQFQAFFNPSFSSAAGKINEVAFLFQVIYETNVYFRKLHIIEIPALMVQKMPEISPVEFLCHVQTTLKSIMFLWNSLISLGMQEINPCQASSKVA